jgi:hypothetical protein
MKIHALITGTVRVKYSFLLPSGAVRNLVELCEGGGRGAAK